MADSAICLVSTLGTVPATVDKRLVTATATSVNSGRFLIYNVHTFQPTQLDHLKKVIIRFHYLLTHYDSFLSDNLECLTSVVQQVST